jgi:lipopolysaccharide export LptBFGC system permease protein LptF
LAVKKQADSKTKATFNQYYPQASKKYDEGQALVDLNQSLATDSFKSAQDLLNQAKSKLPANSNEEKQVEALLQKVNKNLETPKKTAANLDRTKITVSVENGSGVVGAASKIADFLKSKGYQISSTGNADNYNYTNITIQTKSSTSTYVDLLKKDLSQNYTVSSTTSDLPSSSTEDVLVIVGK